MDPITPLDTESDASYGFSLIMNNLAYLRQQAEANNKRPFSATADEVKGLVKLAERDRPLVLNVETEVVVAQLVGQVEELNKQLVATMQQLSTTYLANSEKLIKLVDDRTDYLGVELKLGVKAVQAATVDMTAGAARIPSKITVDFAQGWRWVAGLVLGPLAVVLLVMELCGQFSKVSESDFKKLQAQQKQSQEAQQKAEKDYKSILAEDTYFFGQIKKYRAKNPNTKDFPAYKVPE